MLCPPVVVLLILILLLLLTRLVKSLLDAGHLHGDCLTVTGETVATNLKDVKDFYALPPGQDVIFSPSAPLAAAGQVKNA